jgi:X-X-X-Leu-X-X-Gly heptad repeat protein
LRDGAQSLRDGTQSLRDGAESLRDGAQDFRDGAEACPHLSLAVDGKKFRELNLLTSNLFATFAEIMDAYSIPPDPFDLCAYVYHLKYEYGPF